MKFSAKEDIDAPIEDVFAMVTDFDNFQRAAMRRGAEVRRLDTLPKPGKGAEWFVGFSFRGRRRELTLQLVECDPATGLVLQATSPNMDGKFVIDLLALSKTRTRMAVELDMKPLTLSARLLVQSLKLAKTNLTKRFKLRVAEYAKEMEDRYSRKDSTAV